ncbi:MAG: AAA family ATPase [Lachnospiraceae bacterium]|nr:AAA family ATPase [Lachnospiraceae bacterium]
MEYQPLPIGVEDFGKFYTDEYYYVDKTLFIKELLDKKAVVNLFTRPRRFGKTLVLSMLQYFFEDAYDLRGNKTSYKHYFEQLDIWKAGEKYTKHQGMYPVIFLSLKAGKQKDYATSVEQLKYIIIEEFERHCYILDEDILSEKEKLTYKSYWYGEKSDSEYMQSLKFLSRCLEKYFGQKVIVLIDEYDVPLESAFFSGYYEEMAGFIRGLFENTLKTNNSLYFSVITGCLRISKESIFTGLNNLYINSVLSENYGEYFGFTENEVEKLCDDYGMPQKYQEVKEWYNGYTFGRNNIYNPWSSIYYISDHLANINAYPASYWVNTSGNTVVRELIERADDAQKEVIGNLIAGESVTIPVHEDITYGEIYDNMDNLWNFMFFTGYFKCVAEQFDEWKEQRFITLKIVNREVRYIFINKVDGWFADKMKATDRTSLFTAIISGDTKQMTSELNKLLQPIISYHDYSENYYHGFLAGVLSGMANYVVRSNREAGKGRSDIFIKPLSRFDTAFVMELKVTDDIDDLEEKAHEAIEQIMDKEYEKELRQDGYKKIVRYGVAFAKKDCLVVKDSCK